MWDWTECTLGTLFFCLFSLFWYRCEVVSFYPHYRVRERCVCETMSTTSAPGRSSSPCCSCASRHSTTKRTTFGVQRKGGLFLQSRRGGRTTTLMATNDDGVTKSIGETFDRLKSEDNIAFIPFVVAGDPNLEATEKALKILGTSLVFALFSLFSSFSGVGDDDLFFLSFFLSFAFLMIFGLIGSM